HTGSQGNALLVQVREVQANRLGGAFDGRFGQANAAHFFQQLASLLEAGADTAGEAGQSLHGGTKMMFVQARLLIEGTDTLAAAAAVVVGAAVTEGSKQADQGAACVVVIGCGVATVRAGYAGPLVAVFFCARYCS